MIAERPVRVAVPRTPPAGAEAAARRALRAQVARLERELTEDACATWPRIDLPRLTVAGEPAALLSLGRLEELRDALADRLAESRRLFAERLALEEGNRRLVEEMLADPARHRWVRVSNRDIGEPGCHDWHVRPRFGLLGMLASWWRVVVSSGCPLQPAGCRLLD